MNEEPKSVLKKSSQIPRGTLTWVTVFVCLVLTFIVVEEATGDAMDFTPKLLVAALIASIVIGLWKFCRRLFCWRNVRRFLFGLACFLTLIALFYAQENFRGKRAWNNFKHEWEARGEKFDIASLIPATVPDDQNLAMTPFLRPLFDYQQTTNGVRWNDTNGYARIMAIGIHASDLNHTKAPAFGEKLADLEAWRDYYRASTNFPQSEKSGTAAADVLVALGRFDAEMNELREAAATRPWSRFPIHYHENPPFGILLPHLTAMKGLSQVFVLRSVALTQLGRGEEAILDLQLALRISDSMREELFLIDHLVRLATVTINMVGVREGLARHVWDDGQLARLQKNLSSVDVLAEYKNAMRGERAFNLSGTEYYRRMSFRARPAEGFYLGEEGSAESVPSFANSISILPSGVYYQNMVTIARLHQEFILPAVDETQHRVFPEKSKEMTAAVENMRTTPYNLFGKMMMPALAGASQKTARAQALIDASQIACALERYRLANGKWPESLDALAPWFLEKIPHDVIDGKPLRYRVNADGAYLLYSIGWNQTDDGGIVAMSKGKTPRPNPKQGDWVWQLPAK
jgi:hypothetical protein